MKGMGFHVFSMTLGFHTPWLNHGKNPNIHLSYLQILLISHA